MADNRALFAAFQKVRADVDQALEETRKKEALAREAEERRRLEEKRAKRAGVSSLGSRQSAEKHAGSPAKTVNTQSAHSSAERRPSSRPAQQTQAPVRNAVPQKKAGAQPVTSSAGTKTRVAQTPARRVLTPKGAFGSVLASAAEASGAVFHEAGSEKPQESRKAEKTRAGNEKNVSAGRRENENRRAGGNDRRRAERPAGSRPASAADLADLTKRGLGSRRAEPVKTDADEDEDARFERALRKPRQARSGSDAESSRENAPQVRDDRRQGRADGRSQQRGDRQGRQGREDRRERGPRLSWAERRTPIPPFELMPGLPVSERADEIIQAIRENQVVIVCGETGSGKTTQLPKICLMAGRGETGMIGHTQPRRIAASSIARRIAEELKTEVSEVVGYKVRFTDHTAPGASIKLMTDGILLAETQGDPMLQSYDTIIIDEAHERSINIDFLLGYLKRLLPKRPELKVIVTSATIDAERFAEHFAIDGKPAPVLTISGRTYPVEVRYRPLEDVDEGDDDRLLSAIDDAVSELETAGRGDILIFLPGEREIREAADWLRKTRVGRADILPLYARLSASEQDRVFRPSGGMRRIILATNVAETSVTVPGIRYVVDTGLARVKRYSYRSKVEQLLIEPVSQASANQRAGRCGRVAEGICIRLFDENDFNRRPAFTDPEIMRSNLAAVILRAMALHLGDIREFPFVQAPPPKAFADGFAILSELGCIEGEGDDPKLTAVGEALSRLPVDPRLGRMLLEGSKRNALRELLIISSGLSVQDPRERPIDQQQAADEAHKKLSDERSDFLSYVKLWDWVAKARASKESNRKLDQELKRRFLSPRRLREWREVEGQLRTLVEDLGWRMNAEPATYEEVHRALLSGLLGNIGSKTVESDFRAPPYAGARGIKFWIWPGSVRAKKGGRWVLAGQIVETSKLYARCVADIEPEWIEQAAGSLIRKSWSEPHWEKRRGEVVAMERGTLYGLTLYQQRRVTFAKHDPKLCREIFIREALVEGELDAKLPFYQHNQRLVREIEELEHKTRRPDVLVDDELIFAFYDRELPQDVLSLKTLESWLDQVKAEKPKALQLTRDELMRHDAAGVTTEWFPKMIEMAGVEMALAYQFEPGSPRDGVTMTVPLFALNQLDPVRAEWLVPGMVKEKAQALLKTLPQKIRRNCVPLPEFAAGFLTRSGGGVPQRKGFLEALADDVREETGVPCRPSDFKLEQLAPHLILNFKVVDEHGRQLAMGRNLAELRAELGAEAQATFRQVAEQDAAVAKDLGGEITNWTFGELPELMEIERKGKTLIGHPAIVDAGEACAIEVFDDPLEAAKAHRKGLRKLFRLTLREQVKFVERSLRDLGRVQMQASVVPGLSASFENFEALEQDVVDCVLEATAMTDPLPNDELSFQTRREDVRGRLSLVAGEVSRLLTEIATTATVIPLKLKRAEKSLADEINAQLLGLFPPHFLLSAPLTQLMHYPRYMKAIVYRLDHYADDPARDASRAAEIARLALPWTRAVAARRGQRDPHLEEFRWMLEELRVSLFAQQLRTPMPVSVKRLERIWQSIARL
ncbi:ATP-dependent RNA helicase HrpA [Sutterella sp.]|uniref:ATP-dependent RNA helicase HrpA n=1 Tax=Sutterella sp. TaxID=1981025 RepID=UPI0026DFF86A|nr:ATP-dependent RNA helicase HrpA [Sutterella sp.]MDO5531320.1 ATP-dependent RNA helicase HrpA [Sutterella sp.]